MENSRLLNYLQSRLPVIRFVTDPAVLQHDLGRTDEHLHERQYQLTLPRSAVGNIRIGNHEFPISERCFFLINPYELHELRDPDGRTFPNLTCRFELPGFQGPLLLHRIELSDDDLTEAPAVFSRLHTLRERPDPHGRTRAALILAELLLQLDEQAKSATENLIDSEPVKTALGYLQQNFKQPIRIESAAQAAGVSQEHLCRIFRRETGSTPLDYLQRLRLGYAVERLFASHRKLNSIAEEAGFSNPKTFNAAFLKHYQCTAREFRKKYLEKGAEQD